VNVYREHVRIYERANELISTAQREGLIPQELEAPIDLSALGIPIPSDFKQEMKVLQDPSRVNLPGEFWNPFLRLLAADDAQSRAEILVHMAEEEIRTVVTRLSLKKALG